jgi:hypothetical protein
VKIYNNQPWLAAAVNKHTTDVKKCPNSMYRPTKAHVICLAQQGSAILTSAVLMAPYMAVKNGFQVLPILSILNKATIKV